MFLDILSNTFDSAAGFTIDRTMMAFLTQVFDTIFPQKREGLLQHLSYMVIVILILSVARTLVKIILLKTKISSLQNKISDDMDKRKMKQIKEIIYE